MLLFQETKPKQALQKKVNNLLSMDVYILGKIDVINTLFIYLSICCFRASWKKRENQKHYSG